MAQNNIRGEDTAQIEFILGGGGDTAHTLLMGVLIGVGTPHNIERMKFPCLKLGSVGWVGG